MPLSERARIEVYLPDLPDQAYRDLFDTFEREFAHAFGGCSVIEGIKGSYLSKRGQIITDQVNVLYTDTPLLFERDFDKLSKYADALRSAALESLNEEAVLVSVFTVYHSG